MRKAVGIATTALALAMGLAGCGGGDDAPPENPLLQYAGGWVFTLDASDDTLLCNVDIAMPSASAATGTFTGLCRSRSQAVTFGTGGDIDNQGQLTPASAQNVQIKGSLKPPAGSGTWTRAASSGTWTAKKNPAA